MPVQLRVACGDRQLLVRKNGRTVTAMQQMKSSERIPYLAGMPWEMCEASLQSAMEMLLAADTAKD